jgi:hypothetical protein
LRDPYFVLAHPKPDIGCLGKSVGFSGQLSAYFLLIGLHLVIQDSVFCTNISRFRGAAHAQETNLQQFRK